MIADKLLVKRLHAVLETLDPADQEMIHTVFFDGLSMREYAKQLGVYPRAVVYRMERLLKALRKSVIHLTVFSGGIVRGFETPLTEP